MDVIVEEKDKAIVADAVPDGFCFKMRGSESGDIFIKTTLNSTHHLKWSRVGEDLERCIGVNLKTGETKCFMKNARVYLVTAEVRCSD